MGIDDIDRTIIEFSERYAQAPAGRPFDKGIVRDALAKLNKFGLNDSEAKRRLRDEVTPRDHHDYIRRDAQRIHW